MLEARQWDAKKLRRSGAKFATHGFAGKAANPPRNVQPRSRFLVSENQTTAGDTTPDATSLLEIGARLTVTRKSLGLTQAEMDRRMGLRPHQRPDLQLLRDGRQRIPTHHALALCRTCGLSLDWICRGQMHTCSLTSAPNRSGIGPTALVERRGRGILCRAFDVGRSDKPDPTLPAIAARLELARRALILIRFQMARMLGTHMETWGTYEAGLVRIPPAQAASSSRMAYRSIGFTKEYDRPPPAHPGQD